MNEGLIPRRYAKALYKVAAEGKSTDRIYDLMRNLDGAFRQLPALAEVVNNPFQSNDDKFSLLRTAAGATDADTLFVDFLRLLSDNRRLGMIHEMALAYVGIYRAENNIRSVRLTSAAPLPEDVTGRLKNLVAAHLKGARMEFSTDIDPALIGGFTVAIDNERLDASVSNQLKELRLNLLSKQS